MFEKWGRMRLKVRECDNPYCFFVQNYQWLNIFFVDVPPNQNTINKAVEIFRVNFFKTFDNLKRSILTEKLKKWPC